MRDQWNGPARPNSQITADGWVYGRAIVRTRLGATTRIGEVMGVGPEGWMIPFRHDAQDLRWNARSIGEGVFGDLVEVLVEPADLFGPRLYVEAVPAPGSGLDVARFRWAPWAPPPVTVRTEGAAIVVSLPKR